MVPRPDARRAVLCALIVALLFAVVPAWAGQASRSMRADTDPRACLDGAIAAMAAADMEAFERHVDLETVIAAILPELAAMATDPDTSKFLPPVVTLLASQGVLTNRTMSGVFTREAAEFVRYGVGSGAFGGVPAGDYQGGGLLGPLFGAASMGRKEVTWMGAPTYYEDDRATLPFRVRDHDNDREYDVLGVFSRRDGRLPKLVGIANLRDLILVICAEMAD